MNEPGSASAAAGERSWVRRWAVPLAFLGVAATALLAAYQASSLNSSAGARQPAEPAVTLEGTFPERRGVDGLVGTWMRDSASVTVTGQGRFWLAFHAQSPGRSRALTFTGRDGQVLRARIGRVRRSYILGPLAIAGKARLVLRARPAARDSSDDRRQGSIFLSQLRISAHPIVALPGPGFSPAEPARDGAEYSWLRDRATIEVRAARRNTTRAWLSFSALSSRQGRTLTLRGGRTVKRITLPTPQEEPAGRAFDLGPFLLHNRAATVALATPSRELSHRGASRTSSVRLGGLEALPSPPRQTRVTKAVSLLLGIEAMLGVAAYLLARRRWDRAVVYLLAITAPLEVYRTTVAGFNLSLFRLSLLFAVGWFAASHGMRGVALLRRLAVSRVAAPYFLVAGLVALSLAFLTANPFLAKRLLAVIVVGLAAVLLIAVLGRRSSVEELVRAFVLASVLPILAASWQVLAPGLGTVPELPLLHHLPVAEGLEKSRDLTVSFGGAGVRAKGTFGDPSHYGGYLIFALIGAMALFIFGLLRRDGRGATTFGALAVACGASLVATYSRSTWAGAAVAVLLFFMLLIPLSRRVRIGRRGKLAAAVSTLVTLAVVLPLAPAILERIDPSSPLNSVTNRSHRETARVALEQFMDHPLLGIGAGGLGVVLDQGPRTSGAHSTFLTVAAELGVAGLVALLLAAGFALRCLAKRYWPIRAEPAALVPAALLSGYVGLIVVNLAYDVWWDDFHWLVLGGIVALSQAATVGSPLNRAIGRVRAGTAS